MKMERDLIDLNSKSSTAQTEFRQFPPETDGRQNRQETVGRRYQRIARESESEDGLRGHGVSYCTPVRSLRLDPCYGDFGQERRNA